MIARALSRPARRAFRRCARGRLAERLLGARPTAQGRSIVANLPYSVATLLLIGWLETEPWPPWFERMVLMFQKEVAERIVAAPGSKAYGASRVLAQWRTAPRIVLHGAARSLHAAAQGCIGRRRVRRRDTEPHRRRAGQDAGAGDGRGVRPAAQDAALQPEAAHADPELLLEGASIDPQLRGEALSVADFARLAQVVERMRGAG